MKDAKPCKKGQMLVKSKCITQKGIVYKKLPEIRGKHPVNKIMNFYADLGWDGHQNLEPQKVVVNESDWLKLVKKMESAGMTQDERISAGLIFTNKGPSGSNKIKRGNVKLMKGWV